ncbi:ACP S-malonyltransferase [bacterium]|nr:ACP S-malonyltransferase [bacterium]
MTESMEEQKAGTTAALLALFPGQGAQAVGMGQSLFSSSEKAKARFQEADDLLGEALGKPLSSICFDGPIEQLTQTEVTQPALLTVSTIAFEAWCEENDRDMIAVAAGHSLGEYSALVAAGALAFGDAVRLVHARGSFMQEAVPAGEGAMVAVLGKELPEIEAAISNGSYSTLEVANINAPGQIVLAGSATDVDRFLTDQEGWKTKLLPVSAPFHCSLMKPAEEALAPLLRETDFTAARFPIIQNVTATSTTDPETLRENLIAQVCGSVRWVECMETAKSTFGVQGAKEFGSGKVLSGLLKRIDRSLPCEVYGNEKA